METPIESKLTLDNIFEMSVEELREELENLGQDTKGFSKVQLQKALAKMVSTVQVQEEEWHFKAQDVTRQELQEAAILQRKEDRESEREFELAKLRLQKEMEAKQTIGSQIGNRKQEIENADAV